MLSPARSRERPERGRDPAAAVAYCRMTYDLAVREGSQPADDAAGGDRQTWGPAGETGRTANARRAARPGRARVGHPATHGSGGSAAER